MGDQAKMDKGATTIDVITPAAGYASGEVIQLTDGRAAYVVGLKALVEGNPAALETAGQVELAKTTSIVVLEGAPLWWDRSAGTVTPLKALAGGDFYAGVAIADAAASDDVVVVDINVKPHYTVDLLRDPADTVLAQTAGAPSLTMGPGYAKFLLTTTDAQAEKVDALSQHSVPVTVPFIVEGRIAIYDNGDDVALDINVGIANDTHATSADTITESVFLHVNGNSLTLFAESDDGSTEVAATDTTVGYTEETYFDFAFDCRDLTDIQIYIDGVLVLPDTVFALDAATGPMKLLAHIEKSANDTLGELRISKLALRITDLAS